MKSLNEIGKMIDKLEHDTRKIKRSNMWISRSLWESTQKVITATDSALKSLKEVDAHSKKIENLLIERIGLLELQLETERAKASNAVNRQQVAESLLAASERARSEKQ